MHEASENTEYYFNTQTRMVEKGRLSPWEHLLGPYDSFEKASRALETAEKRSEAWDDADAAWRDDG
ncbi:hypothetical protein LGT39_14310 [Demequina sp. TTPB684]|uniref:hypothetical protein n=1 Tax=unclassified Demequina TaxID=2620311 RepID=UPI001CF33B53|nr:MULTISPECIES: hypothetical protein [unclassified Demequina]MCB2414021.1 hypothetical protein [Demequina sp. TTPB684]UPU89098.1 hypothetical protein LGT36_004020 [Demequina sp. TMPB413]